MNENATMGKLVGLSVAIVVAVIMLATILVPVIHDGQKAVGDIETFTNSGRYSDVLYYSTEQKDVDVTLSSGVWSVNGETVSTPSGLVFVSDKLVIMSNVTSWYANWIQDERWGVRNITAADISISNGVLTASLTYEGDSTYSGTFETQFVAYRDNAGDYIGVDTRQYKPYVESETDVILAGQYYSGDLDTHYWWANGESWTSVPYDMSVTFNLDAVTGTFEGLSTIQGVSVTISDPESSASETFTPYTIIVPNEVSVHTESGSGYSVLGIIPAMIIVALLAGVVAVVFNKKE